MEKLLSQFSSLSLTDQDDFYSRLGIVPHGSLYAYVIPIYNVQVDIVNTKRDGTTLYEYHSKPDDWVLINMGMTTKRNPNDRLDYFHKFKKEFRPNKATDMIYCCKADTSHEDDFRRACYLGGWDIGGKSDKGNGYFTTAGGWDTFLEIKGCGFTECAVIPRTAIARIRKRAETIRYPRTAELCTQVGRIVEEETRLLLKLPKGATSAKADPPRRRGYTCKLQLEKCPKKVGPPKEFPFNVDNLTMQE